VAVALDVGGRCCAWLGNNEVAARMLPLVQLALRRGTAVVARGAHHFMVSAYQARLPVAVEQTVDYLPRLLAVRQGMSNRVRSISSSWSDVFI